MKISSINYNNCIIQKKNKTSTSKPNTCNSYCTNFITPYFGKDLVFQYNRKNLTEFLNNNPRPKAEGTDGIIYKYGNTAVKIAKTKETSFEAEASILRNLPDTLACSQKFIDRFNYNGKDVLVSSFVEGTHKKALSPKDFEQIFEILLEHDKVNIMHGDLNLGNIIFSKEGKISLIDYGAATQPSTTKVELYPDFVTNTNALKLENTGLCDSLKVWKEDGTDKANFEEYLREKSKFYKSHLHLTKTQDQKDYESNLAEILAAPSESVIKSELIRINTLDLLEEADSATNYENNPYNAINLWNLTISSAQEYEKYTAEEIFKTQNEKERKYFEYQNKIAQSFYSTLNEWRNGTINWLYQIKDESYIPQSETEQRIKNNWKISCNIM